MNTWKTQQPWAHILSVNGRCYGLNKAWSTADGAILEVVETSEGELEEVGHWRHVMKAVLSQAPSCISLSASWIPGGEQLCSTRPICHNALPYHRSRNNGASHNFWNWVKTSFPLLNCFSQVWHSERKTEWNNESKLSWYPSILSLVYHSPHHSLLCPRQVPFHLFHNIGSQFKVKSSQNYLWVYFLLASLSNMKAGSCIFSCCFLYRV
jgi:hypothetical protein